MFRFTINSNADCFLVVCFLFPKSPRWLIKKGRAADADTILTKIGGNEYAKAESVNIQKSFLSERKIVGRYRIAVNKRLIIISNCKNIGSSFLWSQQYCCYFSSLRRTLVPFDSSFIHSQIINTRSTSLVLI